MNSENCALRGKAWGFSGGCQGEELEPAVRTELAEPRLESLDVRRFARRREADRDPIALDLDPQKIVAVSLQGFVGVVEAEVADFR
jgi:hypothetical protein